MDEQTTTTETPAGPGPYGRTVVIGQNYWGSGPTLGEAKKQFSKQGGTLSLGYTVLTFDAETSFEGVDGLGRVHYNGNEPTNTEVAPKNVIRR